ncbi:NAD(P)H-quinone oxidoreductase [Bosea sp. 62]|uniref:NAD(P)H-quinone oxidoreductase n=1 Tax=unclassified Bosea (in: a-proteobacteria) TaxID=2653178 RepID=UPI00125A5F29|nr:MULTISPECIES: NAD(P)H-quinone oxidoreductase [unclassified Bosea (in: a-proteobacteria)]CAD5253432.1 NAD(P)H-quinone oxidoreductase [Bosea sp. 46]CAD5258196.1 NAD(P)H-quinone oxidoreductase [Bosea sp. 21B]CAD5282705.1 NAD(P)H-quinone oxidoreductase [Bosea sp. 7B]VVT52025.1 NAD(P)H-quinone oxidoreductase [Bosea sp. EC-HK365B]VXB40093.1 NAD(P)H-quinone oxidoreductase [Bosea sp. 29B]
MQAIEITRPGGPKVLAFCDRPLPALGPGDVLIRVRAAAVNRPDIQQRRGLYPPPPGATDLPGLDVSGVVEAVGTEVSWPKVGDDVCALANGGGYAEFCAVPALQCMPLPAGFSFAEAAALPEVFFTAWNNVVWLGRLADGETLLVQGGTSGVGMAAIQIAKQLRGARVIATAGTAKKRAVCLDIGADLAVDYRADWVGEIESAIGKEKVDVVLDAQAGPYTEKQLQLLAPDGRVVLIASHLGQMAEVNARNIVRRRLTLTGSTLRPRDAAYKGRIAAKLVEKVWPLLESGAIRSHICASFDWRDVRDAHALMDAGDQVGKVVLTMPE